MLVLAGCEGGPTTESGGDLAAAALGAQEISTTSLDADVAPVDAAVASETAVAADVAAATATAGLAAEAATTADATEVVVTPPAKERKGLFGFLKPKPKADPGTGTAETSVTPAARRNSVRLVDRDVEAPDVFQVTDTGLWDGRPSLGGVWVAFADVRDPERVIIRNTETGAFVIGALFRRERENPGPKLQVSSDAATALGMLAGSPAKLNVTALRREEVVDPADAEALLGDGAIDAQAIDPVVEGATAAIAATEGKPVAKPGTKPAADPAAEVADPGKSAPELSAAAPQPEPAPVAKAPARAAGGKPFLQIGIFSVETNANGTAETMRKAGLTAQVIRETSQGKTYWRVIAGPAGSGAERDALLAKAKGLGFADAYFVSG